MADLFIQAIGRPKFEDCFLRIFDHSMVSMMNPCPKQKPIYFDFYITENLHVLLKLCYQATVQPRRHIRRHRVNHVWHTCNLGYTD